MTENELVHSWRELLQRYHATSCALDRTLRDRHDLGFSEFEVLEQLVETPATCESSARRMQELGDRVQLSQSALSRVVARLERDGLVQRTMCADDRRGIYVMLTDEGRRRHAEAVGTHREVLAANLTQLPAVV
ncbi:MAG TPA: MarR family transcriptional regulator [Pseudonocardiaceae bacterium]|nr:MarR family transcriptional regulator [Pseudonocardiaceae bacterium]